MIFYFTATGNSLYAARELAAEGEEVRSIPQELCRGGGLSYADDAIGVVYPIYGHMMPAMVREFVERATFDTPYLYFVCTYGNRHANASELCAQTARAAGKEPAYVSTLLMVDNWLPNFDMDEQRARIPEKCIDAHLARIREGVVARRHWIEPVTDEDRAAREATAGAGCNACLACVHACPAHAISLPMGEKNPAARFRNEHVSLADLIAANG